MTTAEQIQPFSSRLRMMVAVLALGLAAAFPDALLDLLPGSFNLAGWQDSLRNIAASLALFTGAHLIHGLASDRLSRRGNGRRPVPKVALDLLHVVLFIAATLGSLSLFFRQDLSGILTGSGLVLAVLGFAIRNVVADTFSGLALGLEAPFRIGDWVHIDGLALGRVQEIGWRTTRLVTRDSTYVILPNSQISRQRITNFSAPRQEYRDHVELTLPVDLPVAEAKTLIRDALAKARTIAPTQPPEPQVTRYGPLGITYQVKYWVPRHDHEMTCRNDVYSRIDAAMRKKGIRLATTPPTCPELASAPAAVS